MLSRRFPAKLLLLQLRKCSTLALQENPNLTSQVSGNKGLISATTTAKSEGDGSCFKCGKLGHWARDCSAPSGGAGNDTSAVAEKACPCGLGVCSVLTANTERNRGRRFYRCPARQENGGCGFFEWCDNDSATNVMTNGSQNRASSSSYSDLQCPCGAGTCIIRTAKTVENVGQQFYCCPSYQASCGFFQWCKESSTASKNQVSATEVYDNTNDTSKSIPVTARTGSCFKCGGEGHWARDCSQSYAPSNPSSSELGRSQSSSVGGACFKCGKPGHWARDCSSSS